MPRASIAPIALMILLGALCLVVFQQTTAFELTNLDDNLYVTENPNLDFGLSLEGVRWAFTTRHGNLWMPLTWISYLADYQFFGTDAGAYHRTNLLWHLANTLLLFLVLRRLSGTVWRAGLVAALFAVHPLHVESVAWVAERKDVLSGFFFLLTIRVYLGNGPRRSWLQTVGALLGFALALMSKPMVVTLPVVLLLIDFWDAENRRPWKYLLLEKIPYLVLATALAIVTVLLVQTRSIGAPDPIPLYMRLAQTGHFYAMYVGRAIWPADLSVFYPPEGLQFPWIRLPMRAFLLVFLTYRSWQMRDRRRAVWLGWLWFLVMLLPVMGIVQGGMQLMSDRYFYLPSIGLFVVFAWMLAALAESRAWLRRAVPGIAIVLVLAAAFFSHRQAGVWRNSDTLFRNAIAINDEDYLSHMNLGVMLDDAGRTTEALPHLQRAVELRRDPVHQFNLANALSHLNRHHEAVPYYRSAVLLQPEFPKAHNNLGIALARIGENAAATRHFQTAIEQDQTYVGAWYNLGLVQLRSGRTSTAAASFRRTIELNPEHTGAHQQLQNLQVEIN